MVHCIIVGDHEEGTSLEEHNLISLDSLTEHLKTHLELLDVGEQDADNLRPCFVKGLVPNTCLEALSLILKSSVCLFQNLVYLLLEHHVSLLLMD